MNLISKTGFSNEAHKVETSDGYVLKIHRIFPRQDKSRRGPVLLMHGFLGTAADYLISDPTMALAFQLANEGYHVFLGNYRGSKFSMNHLKLDPLSREYWRFSFDEIALQDLPAIINYILFLSQKQSLFYVGHNQGATALVALLSERPEYNAKIIQAHFLSPIVFMDHPHPVLALKSNEFEETARALRLYNFESMVEFTKTIVNNYCGIGDYKYCVRLWEFIVGRNRVEMEIDPKLLIDIPSFISPTASVRQLLHFLQLYHSGKFQSYEGRGQTSREYKLANLQVPLYIYHAENDLIVSRLVKFS
jgi:pimeloyl-ACP methyl ester carboxylesterase